MYVACYLDFGRDPGPLKTHCRELQTGSSYIFSQPGEQFNQSGNVKLIGPKMLRASRTPSGDAQETMKTLDSNLDPAHARNVLLLLELLQWNFVTCFSKRKKS